MRRYGLRSKIYPAFGAIAWVSGISATLLDGLGKADVTTFPSSVQPLKAMIVLAQGQEWYLVPALAIITGLCVVARNRIGEPWVWGAIHHLVDSYRDFVFSDFESDNLHEHRVTLFRFYRWYQYPCLLHYPWTDRLMPVARSGHTSQKTDVSFRVPTDPQQAEAFIGRVWTAFQTLTVVNLPDLYVDSSKDKIREYSEKCFCSEVWIRDRLTKRRIMGRSFCGIPIRVKGIEWGVIIIDSRHPRALGKDGEKFYDLMGRSLGKLLERV
jgi:hypothetical protein